MSLRTSVSGQRKQPFSHIDRRVWIGYALIALSLGIALLTADAVNYNLGDEGDTLTVGWLLTRGQALYRDVFSHHFPGSYLFAAVAIKILGPSLLAVRRFFLVIRSIFFLILARTTPFPVIIGITAVVWSILGPLYLAHTLIYYSVSGLFIFSACMLVVSIISRSKPAGMVELSAVGVLTAGAVFSDAIMVMPVLVLVAALVLHSLSDLDSSSHDRFQQSWHRLAIIPTMWLLTLGFAALWLLSSRALRSFVEDGIFFNLEIYRKYDPSVSLGNYASALLKLLNVFDTQWLTNINPLFRWNDFIGLDGWIFTGFLFRFSVIACSLTMLLRRKFLAGSLFYLFGASLLVRDAPGFHQANFILFSSFSAVYLLSMFISHLRSRPSPLIAFTKGFGRSSAIVLEFAVSLLAGSMFLWLIFRVSGVEILEFSERLQSNPLDWIESNSWYLNELACDVPDAKLLELPWNPMLYFSSGLPPVSKYLYLTPWVAEIGLQPVLKDLATGNVIVQFDNQVEIWGYSPMEFLGPIQEYLAGHYLEQSEGFYLSPGLVDACQDSTLR